MTQEEERLLRDYLAVAGEIEGPAGEAGYKQTLELARVRRDAYPAGYADAAIGRTPKA